MQHTKIIIATLLLTSVLRVSAQRKVAEVKQSTLTGISLPDGTKQDPRLLTVAGAEIVLYLQCSSGVKLKNTEVLTLPPVIACGYNADSLVNYLYAQGWAITPDEKDNKYVWLTKDGRYLFAYFSMGKKATDLYISEATNPPTLANSAPQQPVYTGPAVQQPVQQPQQAPPVQYDPAAQQQQPVIQQPTQTYTAPPPATPSAGNGILVSTTNFDDGWTAMPMDNYVRVTKAATTVYLHYGLPIPDNMRADNEAMRDYYWNTLTASRYQVSNINKRTILSSDYPRIYFMEADGTDNTTGNPVHIAFQIFMENGVGSCVEIVCPTKGDYDAQFPDLQNIEKMSTYNRFALSDADLTGTWQNTSHSSADYYNVYTGAHAGTNLTSLSDQFAFSTGTYQAEHKGASGMAGNAQVFQQKENGAYQVTYWDVTTTDQKSKTTVYHAYYQAVKNGRILHLQNKQYSGIQYHLLKTQ
jgi:hypothetical protein